MLHWWGFSPVDVGRDSKRNKARHSRGGRMRDRKTRRQQQHKRTKLKKIKSDFVNGSPLIRKIQSFLASCVLRKLALKVMSAQSRVFHFPMPENGSLGKLQGNPH